jgi:ABC-2 type transport system permease protein
MNRFTYVRYEMLRTFRNRRFFLFSLGFPLVLYVLVAAPNRGVHDLGGSGIGAPLYLMIGLATLGTMNAVLGAGGRIAVERTVGWTRHLRATPLRPRTYIVTKVLGGYLTATVTIAVLYTAGIALGVRLSASEWLGMTGLLLVGLLPFSALAIALGHLVGVDALGPAIGGTTGLLTFLGGAWFPLGPGLLRDVAQALPSYWLVRASAVSRGGGGWSATGWLVVGVWAVALAAAAVWAYRRDTERA